LLSELTLDDAVATGPRGALLRCTKADGLLVAEEELQFVLVEGDTGSLRLRLPPGSGELCSALGEIRCLAKLVLRGLRRLAGEELALGLET
jgi:hypothetical protein